MRYLARDLDPELVVARTRGSHLFDTPGRKYIDFVMGWCVGNFGWRNAALARAVRQFRGPDYVYPGFAYKRSLDASRRRDWTSSRNASDNLDACINLCRGGGSSRPSGRPPAPL
jgi:hypothetical protein